MVCRMWHGWTTLEKARGYECYLKDELFPRVERELRGRGYRGFHLLTMQQGLEVEFVTMLWFDSIDDVKSFAGSSYTTPVISDKARSLLARYAEHADHFDLSGASWPEFLSQRSSS
jgi:hypothetical protein